MFAERDYAYKIGCGRLIFEDHASYRLAEEILRIGRKPYILSGPHAWQEDGEQVTGVLNRDDVPYSTDIYAGACSEEKAAAIIGTCKKDGCDCILGVGGGRIMDLAKLAGNMGNIPVINMPTIAATCAAYTPLSVVYTPEGACRGTWYFRKEVDAVLCDVSLLMKEPVRYLNAGMLDAMAKWVEINHYADRRADVAQDEMLAKLLAKQMYDDLKRGRSKISSQDRKTVTEVLFHNIVTTGMISGIARGNFQAALAHGLYYAIRTLYGRESRPYLHGEVVAVGMLYQEMYLGYDGAVCELKEMLRDMNMPCSLSAIGVPANEEALRKLAAYPSVTELYYDPDGDTEKTVRLLKKIM